jgi:hypothetical protein
MKFNTYELLDSFQITQIENSELKKEIEKRFKTIEQEIILEYLKKQEGKLGIKNLGNEIRYNSILKSEFKTTKNNKVIIKMTENRRSFIKVFLDNWIYHNNKDIYYFILEKTFGNDSKIVDNSFISINEVKEELLKFYSYFKKTNIGPKVYFIELKGFNDYNVIDNEGYSFLQINR